MGGSLTQVVGHREFIQLIRQEIVYYGAQDRALLHAKGENENVNFVMMASKLSGSWYGDIVCLCQDKFYKSVSFESKAYKHQLITLELLCCHV